MEVSRPLTAEVEPDRADGGDGAEDAGGVEQGQAEQERQRGHGPRGVHGRARVLVERAEHLGQGNALVARHRPQHPEQGMQ